MTYHQPGINRDSHQPPVLLPNAELAENRIQNVFDTDLTRDHAKPAQRQAHRLAAQFRLNRVLGIREPARGGTQRRAMPRAGQRWRSA